MLICADIRIPFSRSLVYTTYRDKLVELVPYLSNVRSLEVKSRRQEDGQIYCVIEWQGGGRIPLVVRAVLGEAMLSWTEYDRWDESDFTLEWQLETHAFSEAVSCAGLNRFLQEGSTTVIETRGSLTIDPQQIKGVPQPFQDKIAGIVETFLGKKIVPNLMQMSEGVRHYLEQAANDRS